MDVFQNGFLISSKNINTTINSTFIAVIIVECFWEMNVSEN